MERIEQIILASLVRDDDYTRKVLPFIKEEYFGERTDRKIFSRIQDFVNKYNNLPTREAMMIGLDEESSLTESEYKDCKSTISEIYEPIEEVDKEWLFDNTEKFCKDRSIYNAILESISIIDGKSKDSKEHLPKLLQDALAVSFDNSVGHDYIDDHEDRYKFYHMKEEKISFDLDFFNKITNGGVPTKTLNIVMAGTGVGKSLFMCHHASNCLSQSKNVLYITCEMAEERIAERIDANLMDITMDELKSLPESAYKKKIERATKGITGKLIVKEYPTATANINHFRALIEELKLKKKFTPDIIFIDYLNICAAARFKNGANVNSYMYVKAIAEELRGLAVEMNVPIFSATQTNRTGFTSTDVGLEDTSESFGLPATADFMFALIATEELDTLNQVLVKQLKNRYNDPASNRKFILGINRAKMKLYDVGAGEQEDLVCSGQNLGGVTEVNYSDEKFSDWKI